MRKPSEAWEFLSMCAPSTIRKKPLLPTFSRSMAFTVISAREGALLLEGTVGRQNCPENCA